MRTRSSKKKPQGRKIKIHKRKEVPNLLKAKTTRRTSTLKTEKIGTPKTHRDKPDDTINKIQLSGDGSDSETQPIKIENETPLEPVVIKMDEEVHATSKVEELNGPLLESSSDQNTGASTSSIVDTIKDFVLGNNETESE